jgi:hypothetical protein
VRFFCFLRQSAAQITIGDYAKWRPIFDKHKPLRDRAGQNNVRAYRGADNPKELVIWSEVSDAAKAREALGSPEIRSAAKSPTRDADHTSNAGSILCIDW